MIRLVIVKNPFQPWQGREIKNIPNGFTLRQAVDMTEFKGLEINCVINGKTVEVVKDYVIPDDDIIVLSPMVAKGGKSFLGIIAMVAMAAISVGAGSLAVHGGLGIAGGTFGSYAAAAAIMFVGSTLIGKLTAPKPDTGTHSSENDQTYSWSGVQTMEGQNNPIVMTYGKVKSAGQTIGKNISVDDSKEYLNWLIAAGEGPLDITDIKLNDNAADYYSGVSVEVREGTNDQEIISYFNDTYFSKNLGYQLLDAERIDTAQGNATEKIVVKVEFSNGLYYATDDGNLGLAWVDLAGWYRLKGTTEWTQFVNQRISGSQSSAIRREFSRGPLAPGEYEVKLQITGRSHSVTDSRASTRCWWSSITSVVYDDFIYPNIALIGIRALATDQINGTPQLSFMKERANVWVWNPYSMAYEQKPANNPAWASYDMLHMCTKIKNINTDEYEYEVRGAAKELLLYDQFNEWANFCNAMDLKVNIEVTQAGELLEIINQNIANCGRGMVVRFGTKYGCVWDSVKQPVQMFGMGNIISGTFKEDFMQVSDRANCVEITYTDAVMDYSRNTITIYSDDYDTDPQEKIAQSTYNGITSYEQAYREGKYQLYCNKYLLRTVSFDANVDSIACTIGDVILVAHDVPKWAYSGRIYSVDMENNTLTLPVEVEDPTQNYQVMYRTVNDNLKTIAITILSNADGWCTVRCATEFGTDDPPQVNDVFDLAIANVGSKPFVVKSISRSSEFVRKIECLEYNENVYNENYNIPPLDYSRPDISVENVSNLVARQNKQVDNDGSYQYVLEASWEYDKAGTFSLYGSYDGFNFIPLVNTVNDRSYSAILQYELVYLRVVTNSGLKQSTGVTVAVESLNQIQLPSVLNARGYNKYREFNDDVVRYDIAVEWTPPNFVGYKQCNVWYKTSGSQGNSLGVIPSDVPGNDLGFYGNWTFGGQGYDNVIIPQAIIGDTYKIAICTQDMYGNAQDPNMAVQLDVVVAMKSETPNTPNNLGTSLTDTFNISWDEVRNADIKYYEVRLDTAVGVENASFIARTTENNITTNIITSRTGTIYVFAVSAYGKTSAPAVATYNYSPPSMPTISVEVKIQGIECKCSDVPNNCIGVRWFFDGTETNEDITSSNTTYYYSASPGIYEVSACFYDYFGDGDVCIKEMANIQAHIPSELFESGSITLDKLSEDAQKAIEEGGLDTVNVAVKGMLGEGSALVLQPSGELALVASNGEVLTGMFINKDGVITLDGSFIRITGDTVIDGSVITNNMLAGGITADKMQVSSLSAITGTIGTLRTATTGARVEITNNLIVVYDNNEIPRVRLGIWENE